MGSVYPGGLDNFDTNRVNSTPLLNTHPQDHDDLADAVNKIEATLGVDPQDGYPTVSDRIAAAGNMILQGYDQNFSGESSGNISMDGNNHTISYIPGDEPTWLDGSMRIVVPGLYMAGIQITQNHAATNTGLRLRVAGVFTADWLYPLQNVAAFSPATNSSVFTDIQSLKQADLPWGTNQTIQTPVDATATIFCRVVLAQLATIG